MRNSSQILSKSSVENDSFEFEFSDDHAQPTKTQNAQSESQNILRGQFATAPDSTTRCKTVPSIFSLKFRKLNLHPDIRLENENNIHSSDFSTESCVGVNSPCRPPTPVTANCNSSRKKQCKGILKWPDQSQLQPNSLRETQPATETSQDSPQRPTEPDSTSIEITSEKTAKTTPPERIRKDALGNRIIRGGKKHSVVIRARPEVIIVQSWKQENKILSFQGFWKPVERVPPAQEHVQKRSKPVYLQDTTGSLIYGLSLMLC